MEKCFKSFHDARSIPRSSANRICSVSRSSLTAFKSFSGGSAWQMALQPVGCGVNCRKQSLERLVSKLYYRVPTVWVPAKLSPLQIDVHARSSSQQYSRKRSSCPSRTARGMASGQLRAPGRPGWLRAFMPSEFHGLRMLSSKLSSFSVHAPAHRRKPASSHQLTSSTRSGTVSENSSACRCSNLATWKAYLLLQASTPRGREQPYRRLEVQEETRPTRLCPGSCLP